jgi:hypothetical protein
MYHNPPSPIGWPLLAAPERSASRAEDDDSDEIEVATAPAKKADAGGRRESHNVPGKSKRSERQ